MRALNQSGYAVLSQSTVAEIVTTVLPCALILIGSTISFSLPLTMIGWFTCGVGGLVLTIGLSRANVLPSSILDWPQPQSGADIAVSAIAYNGVIVLGTVLAEFVWQVTSTILFAVPVGILLPLWFLKHIKFIAFIDSE